MATPSEQATCVEDGGCWDRHGECTGCQTAPAEGGALCARCSRRLRDLLGDREQPEGPHGFAWIYDWLGQNLDPVSNPRPDGRGSAGDAPVPIRLEVLDVQFMIAETLRGWLEAAIESVPYARLAGPRTLSAGSISRWLLAQINLVEAAPFAAEIVDELDELSGEAHRCAPWRPANRNLGATPCPFCHTPALRIRGGEADITCAHCSAWIDSARYKQWTAWLEAHYGTNARKRAGKS